MYFSHISIGGGITGLETIISTFAKIKKELQKSQNAKKRIRPKKITFAIIDKNPENIPGGVAYGFSLSRYGYFNNPIRLSPTQFTTWLLYGKNKKKLESYLKRYGGYTGKEWLKKNKNILFLFLCLHLIFVFFFVTQLGTGALSGTKTEFRLLFT